MITILVSVEALNPGITGKAKVRFGIREIRSMAAGDMWGANEIDIIKTRQLSNCT